MQPSNLELHYKRPIVARDGDTVMINEKGQSTLVFFQVRKQTPQAVEADVVAAVRFHDLDELKQLRKVIGDTIKQHEAREK